MQSRGRLWALGIFINNGSKGTLLVVSTAYARDRECRCNVFLPRGEPTIVRLREQKYTPRLSIGGLACEDPS